MLSPKDFVLWQVGTYPTMFAADTFEIAELNVAEHLFNTIGNGYSFKTLLKHNAPDTKAGEKYVTSRKVCTYRHPNINNATRICCIPSEMHLYPEIPASDWAIWDNIELVPYPNFDRLWSLVWTDDFRKSSVDWICMAERYYQWAGRFFTSTSVSKYSCFGNDNWEIELCRITKFITETSDMLDFIKHNKQSKQWI